LTQSETYKESKMQSAVLKKQKYIVQDDILGLLSNEEPVEQNSSMLLWDIAKNCAKMWVT